MHGVFWSVLYQTLDSASWDARRQRLQDHDARDGEICLLFSKGDTVRRQIHLSHSAIKYAMLTENLVSIIFSHKYCSMV
jgi:hypothetical protein